MLNGEVRLSPAEKMAWSQGLKKARAGGSCSGAWGGGIQAGELPVQSPVMVAGRPVVYQQGGQWGTGRSRWHPLRNRGPGHRPWR